jgi:hypothetical protein
MIPTKKGQSDTFKLLIAAVVAMAILAIVASILGSIDPDTMDCVSNPINDMATTISKSKSGLEASTGKICMQEGESFTATALKNRVDGLQSVTFSCYQNSPMCDGSDTAPIDYSADRVTANRRTSFSALIDCPKSGDSYACTIQIKSAE